MNMYIVLYKSNTVSHQPSECGTVRRPAPWMLLLPCTHIHTSSHTPKRMSVYWKVHASDTIANVQREMGARCRMAIRFGMLLVHGTANGEELAACYRHQTDVEIQFVSKWFSIEGSFFFLFGGNEKKTVFFGEWVRGAWMCKSGGRWWLVLFSLITFLMFWCMASV